jgi:hypothetical protein
LLLKGDNNSEYFHRVANGRKRRQTIFSLLDGDVSVQGDKDLLEHVTCYYKSLFGLGGGNAFDFDHNLWSEESKVSEQENLELTKPFSEEEIKFAHFEMDKNKAAGPDGLPIEFFQVSWPIIKEDIIELFAYFYLGRMDIKRINYDIIALLPKSKEASRIQQFKPICL